LRQAVSLAQSCFSKLPAKALFARQHEFRARIRKTVHSHRFDAVLINGSDMLWVVDELPPEIEHLLAQKTLAAKLEDSPLKHALTTMAVRQRKYHSRSEH
jgi:hypothetical protein